MTMKELPIVMPCTYISQICKPPACPQTRDINASWRLVCYINTQIVIYSLWVVIEF